MDYIPPVGGRFLPEDEELVGHFLFKKLNGGLSSEEAWWVPECDLYGQEEPWVLFERLKTGVSGGDVFVFTELKCKDKGKRKIDRRVGGGCWHGEDSGKEIAVSGQIKAKKKRFSYKNKDSDHHGGWILHEYSFPNCPIVLCRLRNNSSDLNPDSESCDEPPLDFDFFESLKAADVYVEGSHKRRRPEFENPADLECNNTAASAQPDLMRSNLESSHGAHLESNNGAIKRRRLEFNNSCNPTESSHGADLEFSNARGGLQSNDNPVDMEGNGAAAAAFESWRMELQKLELDCFGQDWEFETLINGSPSYSLDYDASLEGLPATTVL